MKTETKVGIFIILAIGIFIYLSVNIGALRLDMAQYNTYKTFFDDIGGLDLKAPVKIAGVDIGWVDAIELQPDGKAEIIMRVNKNIKLAKNAYAVISQEGLIGTKTLEIEPGDPLTGFLLPGSTLSMPGRSPATVSDLLDQFKDIASSVQDIAYSFKSVFATQKGEDDMKMALDGIAKASNRMADFSEVLERTMKKNEENINSTLNDMRSVMHHLDDGVPSVVKNFDEAFPAIRDASNTLKVAFAEETLPKVSSAFESLEETSDSAKETFRQAEQVVEKINTGKGLIGKLVNEDETYDDIKKTIRGLKDYVAKTQSLAIDVDMHSETSLDRDWNSKGYLHVRLRPSQDYFYQFQIVSDERGTIIRDEEHREWFDKNGYPIEQSELNYGNSDYGQALDAHDKLEFAKVVDKTTRRKNDLLFGFQFGKRFNRLALRVGMFENTFGLACDYYVPLKTSKFHWITSLEAFDFKGTNRLDDKRPHIRWINKIFFMKNLYTAFGISDAIGKHTSAPFWGGGLRFGDDDLKYILSALPVGKFTMNR
ncbi:MCE family protein [Candidatus Dependentiae bacterium]|nr:MCE family protein [Candidatus Dependentiae bacterium]